LEKFQKAASQSTLPAHIRTDGPAAALFDGGGGEGDDGAATADAPALAPSVEGGGEGDHSATAVATTAAAALLDGEGGDGDGRGTGGGGVLGPFLTRELAARFADLSLDDRFLLLRGHGDWKGGGLLVEVG